MAPEPSRKGRLKELPSTAPIWSDLTAKRPPLNSECVVVVAGDEGAGAGFSNSGSVVSKSFKSALGIHTDFLEAILRGGPDNIGGRIDVLVACNHDVGLAITTTNKKIGTNFSSLSCHHKIAHKEWCPQFPNPAEFLDLLALLHDPVGFPTLLSQSLQRHKLAVSEAPATTWLQLSATTAQRRYPSNRGRWLPMWRLINGRDIITSESARHVAGIWTAYSLWNPGEVAVQVGMIRVLANEKGGSNVRVVVEVSEWDNHKSFSFFQWWWSLMSFWIKWIAGNQLYILQ